jgi:hypothetical protein
MPWSSSPCNINQCAVTSALLGSKYFPRHPILKDFQSVLFPRCERSGFIPISNKRRIISCIAWSAHTDNLGQHHQPLCVTIEELHWTLWNQLFCHNLYAYLLTCLLTYPMEQSPFWEVNWFAASQEIPLPCMGPKGSLPHFLVPITCPYPEPDQSSPYSHISLPEDPS